MDIIMDIIIDKILWNTLTVPVRKILKEQLSPNSIKLGWDLWRDMPVPLSEWHVSNTIREKVKEIK